MIRSNKRKLIISSVLILLPVVFGLIMWNKLPEHMATHWGINGEADGYAGRVFSVFALPLILLAFHWICVYFTAKDPGNKGQNQKVFSLVIWLMPVISLFANALVYASAFEKEIEPVFIMVILLSAVFIAVGNYMPKCGQNHTIGIKLKWTLQNKENWNATHRFAGRVWVIMGIFMMACAFLPEEAAVFVLVCATLALALVPIMYSYLYYRKQVKAGTYSEDAPASGKPNNKKGGIAAAIILAAVLGLICVILFTGDIEYVYAEDAFTVSADFWKNLTVEYAAIDEIEYRDTDERGSRTNGFGSPRLVMGTFKNDEFGYYTRYSYVKCESCVVIRADEKVLVLSGADEEETRAIYDAIDKNIKNAVMDKEGQ